jgi:predicted nucleic acid-binding protein
VLELVERGLIRVEEVSRSLPRLGLGESSAILLALEKGKIVVLDDKRARRLARELGLEVIGTLSILKRLYEMGALKMSIEAVYVRLLEIGFYVKRDLFNKVFNRD